MTEKHCFHTSGQGTSYFTGGNEQYHCCWCNAHFTVPWSLKQEPIRGHGPHAHQDVKVYDWPADECPREGVL